MCFSPARGLAGEATNRADSLRCPTLIHSGKLVCRSRKYKTSMSFCLTMSNSSVTIPVLETGNTDVLTQMLLKNMGVSFLPEFVVRDYLADGRLVALDTVCPEIEMWSQLVYHRNKLVTPQMEIFIELMRNLIS